MIRCSAAARLFVTLVAVVGLSGSPLVAGSPERGAAIESRWTTFRGDQALEVVFQGTSRLITGLGILPGDRVRIAHRDIDGDFLPDVEVYVDGALGRVVHHVALSPLLPEVLDIGRRHGLGADFTIVDLASDTDNFGFDGGMVPCAFFDNSEPEDLGVFDRELSGGDEVESWVHDLRDQDPPGGRPSRIVVTVEIRETFSDPGEDSTLTIEGFGLSFEADGSDCEAGCTCNFGTIHTFSGATMRFGFLRDLEVAMTFAENGDDIGLDYSRLTIDGFF